MWIERDNFKRIINTARKVIRRANKTAHSLGLGHRFLYQGYAAADQDVFPTYGNYARLKAVSEKYDPNDLLTKTQPGYFNFEKR